MNWAGSWDSKRDGAAVCRWMIAWDREPKTGYVCGAVAGYSGHGAFELEKFVILPKGEVALLDSLAKEPAEVVVELCEHAQDIVLSMHDDDDWLDSDTLHLRSSQHKELQGKNNVLYGGDLVPGAVAKVLELVAVTAQPAKYQITE
jgi:hypothetical protein